MIKRIFSIVLLSVLFVEFTTANAALNIAFASRSDKGFMPLEYSSAKIRNACIEVHGEEWFKNKILLERKYRTGALFLSNLNFTEISCRDANPRDLLDLKAVFDYMAQHNDTLYIPIMDDYFERIDTSSINLNSYIRKRTLENYKYSVLTPIGHFLRIGSAPDINDSRLIIINFAHFYLGSGSVIGNRRIEYKEICMQEDCIDMESVFDKAKVRKKDIDLYYKYTLASDKILLETRPKRTIPIDAHYDYNPNGRVALILNENVYIDTPILPYYRPKQ